ncbi:MAG: hypothetical protein AAGB31_12170 [Bdellovibrio sp.]
MNLFNCFQAVAFYTVTPFGIQWLATNGFNTWAIVAGVGMFVGYILMSIAVHQATEK